jgi:hypothetical protein
MNCAYCGNFCGNDPDQPLIRKDHSGYIKDHPANHPVCLLCYLGVQPITAVAISKERNDEQ